MLITITKATKLQGCQEWQSDHMVCWSNDLIYKHKSFRLGMRAALVYKFDLVKLGSRKKKEKMILLLMYCNCCCLQELEWLGIDQITVKFEKSQYANECLHTKNWFYPLNELKKKQMTKKIGQENSSQRRLVTTIQTGKFTVLQVTLRCQRIWKKGPHWSTMARPHWNGVFS